MIRAIVLASLFWTPALAEDAPAAGTAAEAASPAPGAVDPDWPCVQRRQPALSLAQVWSGPLPDDATAALIKNAAVQDLSRVIALRRTPMEEVDSGVAAFAGTHEPGALTALMVATLDHINHARNRVLSGITRYAHKQVALDERINTLRHEFEAANAASPQDFDRIDALETELDWTTRVFRDRQQSLTYVCETPVILEQRAFAVGRVIAARLPG
jgi:hypothetical protein